MADETVIDGDAVTPITASGPIDFGNVCVGATATTTRLVAAKRTTETGNVRWGNSATLTATATATGGATTTVPDSSIALSGWNSAGENSFAGDTAQVTLSVVASATPATMTGNLTVALSGSQQGGGGATLMRDKTLTWVLNAVSCNTSPSITVNDVTLEGNTLGGRTLAFADIGTASDAEDSEAPSVTCTPALGSVLPLGTTTVTCTAQDSGNLTTSDSGDVTVEDTLPPVITGTPDSVTVEATSDSGATHTYVDPTATDVVWGQVAVTCEPPSGSAFAIDATTVTCTATDGADNSDTTSFQVNVQDETAPDFEQPADVTAEATSGAGALVTYPTPSATDAVSRTIEGTCTPASGTLFALGGTDVECTATDDAGNEGTTSFVVRVVDTTAPDLDVPGDITEEATSASGTQVSYTATATDAVDDNPTVVCTPVSGTLFGLGAHEVTCTATDNAGNSLAETFTVTVRDTTAPVLEQLPDATVEGNTSGGALWAYTAPTANDVVDPTPTVECEPVESALFELGETTVTCTATDASGNTSSDTFTVTVVDTTDPQLWNVPTDETVEGNTTGGAYLNYTPPTATDIVDEDPTVECTPSNTEKFDLGPTTVTCTATDDSANTASDSFIVTVVDTTDPTIVWVSTEPAANAEGWSNSDVTVTWECTDVVGVQSETVTQVLSTEGADLSATGTCADTSGNTASDTRTGINLDKSGPTANLDVSAGTLGDNGWYVSDATIRTTGGDDLSGPPTCTPDQVLATDTTGTVFNGSCTNKAGLTTGATAITVKRDTVAPTIADEGIASGTSGADGWYTSAVTNRFTATDDTSGVVDGLGDFNRGSGLAEGSSVTISSGPVKDRAGNEAASLNSAPYKIDLSDPTGVTFVDGPAEGSSHYFGQVPAAPTCTASDAVSGIKSCLISGYSTAVGTHMMTATATDNAGRTATATRSYTVLGWTLHGFYQPVDMSTENTVVYNSVKNGSTVPLKFEVFAGSTEKTTVDAVKSLTYAQTACTASATTTVELETVATGGTVLRYDSPGGQFVYNWKTPSTAGKCYRVTMTTQDNSTLVAFFKLK